MRIFLCELKKIWNRRSIAVIAALAVLVWFAALADSLSMYDSFTTHGSYGKYQTEMFRLYGDELSPKELAEYDIPGKIAEVHAEADAIIASEPIFAEYGISDFADYLEYENGHTYIIVGDQNVVTTPNGKTVSEGNFAAMYALLNGGDEPTLDEWYDSPANRANCLNNLQRLYAEEYRHDWLAPYIEEDLRPVVVRAAEKLDQARNANLIRYDLCLTSSAYAAVVGIFSLLAVMILVAPLVANDRRRKLNLLQYSSAAGRKIFKIQFAATAVSAVVLSIAIIAAGYIPFLNAAWEYRNAHIMAPDHAGFGMWLYNITFGQYVIILAAMSLAVSVGAACFTFALARFSGNIVTLMIKAVPVGAAVAAICAIAVYNALSYENIIFNLFLGRVDAPEIIVCGVVMITGIITAVVVMVRERRIDVT
jgi:hypothetical protein